LIRHRLVAGAANEQLTSWMLQTLENRRISAFISRLGADADAKSPAQHLRDVILNNDG
jgi:hypothetical protein